MDSLQTMNLGFTGETNRILVGAYNDPALGTLTAEAYAQFRSTSVTTAIPPGAVFDSLVLELNYDYYFYGSSGASDLTFAVHEITKELNNDSLYFSTSTIPYNPIPLGNKTTIIDGDFFTKEAEDTDKDSVLIVKIKLDQLYGQTLFDAIDPEDENYTNFNLFKTKFKGLAILPQQADKIVGISTNNINTSLSLYYHTGDINSILKFALSQGVNFSKISADRTITELSGLNQFHTDFSPPDNRYLQSGASLITKLDLSQYYEYIDTLENIIINSAELIIDNVNVDDGFAPPGNLALSLLTNDNRYKFFKTSQDTIEYVAFGGTVVAGPVANINLPTALFAGTDQGDLLSLSYSKTNNNYIGAYPTVLFQKLFDQKENQYPYWALVPINPTFSKSLNRVVFPKDNIKLKIYYTLPFIEPTE